MAAGQEAQAAGERVEKLLAELRSHGGPQVAATAEELVGCLVELYGTGLAEIVRILGEDAEAGARLLDALAADPLVESLLLVHDLHPIEIGARIERALDAVMPRLGPHAGHAEFQGIDDQGVIHLRLERGGHGCNSSAGAYVTAIEQAVAEAAPEAAGVDVEVVEVPAELPLLQIGRRPAVASPVGTSPMGTRGSR
jgi:Fe-S cluster biogenesis protein NfuA